MAMTLSQADAQTKQRVEVRIRDYAFIASQAPLVLNATTVSAIRHEDGVGHNSASPSFQAIETQVGRGIGGVFVDPNAGMALRFTVKRPGRSPSPG